MTAWVERFFIAKLRAKVKKAENPSGVKARSEATLTPAEMDRAGKLWVKQAQTQRFSKEMQELSGGKEVSRQSQLKPLTPMLDELGILQVGGRLTRAELPYDAAHRVILPKKHHITRLIVADVHNRYHHAGVNHLPAQVRHRYWIIDGRQEVKNWGKECKVCDRKTCTTGGSNYGSTSGIETWNNDESVCKMLC